MPACSRNLAGFTAYILSLRPSSVPPCELSWHKRCFTQKKPWTGLLSQSAKAWGPFHGHVQHRRHHRLWGSTGTSFPFFASCKAHSCLEGYAEHSPAPPDKVAEHRRGMGDSTGPLETGHWSDPLSFQLAKMWFHLIFETSAAAPPLSAVSMKQFYHYLCGFYSRLKILFTSHNGQ